MNSQKTPTEGFGASLGSPIISTGCLGFRNRYRMTDIANNVLGLALVNTFVLASILRSSAFRRQSKFQCALKSLRLV